jgi:hypothetical protein
MTETGQKHEDRELRQAIQRRLCQSSCPNQLSQLLFGSSLVTNEELHPKVVQAPQTYREVSVHQEWRAASARPMKRSQLQPSKMSTGPILGEKLAAAPGGSKDRRERTTRVASNPNNINNPNLNFECFVGIDERVFSLFLLSVFPSTLCFVLSDSYHSAR